jgi:hypothetical protein
MKKEEAEIKKTAVKSAPAPMKPPVALVQESEVKLQPIHEDNWL